jgi:hypothetical protein
MTNDEMNLHALAGKTADGDFLREMIGFAAQRLMELEVGGLTLNRPTMRLIDGAESALPPPLRLRGGGNSASFDC